MRKIQLTQGQFTLVDDEDFEELNQYKWYARKDRDSYYASRDIYNNNHKTQLQMHRIIMDTPVDLEVDHINGDKLDNRKSNLRNCTHSNNTKNRKSKIIPRSGIRGIQLTESGNYRAGIAINGKYKYFPTRGTLEEAIKDRKSAEISVYKEFASNR